MMPASDPPTERYQALALQITTHSLGAARDARAAKEIVGRNLSRIERLIAAGIGSIMEQHGQAVRLVVLPEYSLTGAPSAGRFTEWRHKAALEMNGHEYARLGTIAARHEIFLAGNAYEADDNFPELYFQTSFVVAPSGDVALRYRRLISLYSPSPYDLFERYAAQYGAYSLFPVISTPIGRLAAIASEEILYPEIARCHVMNGAEILVHSTSEMGSPALTAKDLAKRARAAENLAYVVSANAAAVVGTALPSRSTTGMSKIVRYDGQVIAAAAPGGDSVAAHAGIDLAALRAIRRQSGLTNVLARQPFQAYAESYRATVFHASEQLDDIEAPGTDSLRATQARTIARLAKLGLI